MANSFTENTTKANLNFLYETFVLYLNIAWDMMSTQVRNSVHLYKKNGILYEPGTPQSEVSDEFEFTQIRTVKVVSYNIDDIACHRHRYPNKDAARAMEIVSYLESTNADVICLQEVWSETMKQELTDAFLAKHFYIALPPWYKKYVFGENTGLMTISRYPIVTQTFVPFDTKRGLCRFMNKGVQFCHIRIPNMDSYTEFNIANTHLQTSYSMLGVYMDFEKIAKQQLCKIIDETPYEWSLLAGSFNISKNNMDNFIESEKNIKYFGENSDSTKVNSSDRSDYIALIKIVPGEDKIMSNSNKIDSDINLSDHYPLVTDVELKLVLRRSARRASP